MLAGKRALRVGDQILREIAIVLIEKVNDPRIKGATLTGIRLSNDLKNARVFYSIIGSDTDIVKAQTGLDSAKGFIKRAIGARLALKYMPDITFKHDPTLQKGHYMERLLNDLVPDESPEPSE
ncbi:30S ribosome-binding factor RbfA [Thermodesulfobacteriota bacterium]